MLIPRSPLELSDSMSSNLTLTQHLSELYARGENLITHLKSVAGRQNNTVEDIMLSYDFQAGSYIKRYEASPDYLDRYTGEIVEVLNQLGSFGSLLEVGCGEATTLSVLGNQLLSEIELAGFDISWSRVKLGSEFSKRRGLNPSLFCADFFNIPLADKSVDIVYTSHSIEPNGGREREALRELARVARKWLVILEPAYDLADLEARQRMEKHGYVRNLAEAIHALGLELFDHRLFPVSANPLNPTGLYLVRLNPELEDVIELRYKCPVSGSDMKQQNEAFFSPTSLLAYPILGGIPCLSENNAILATQFLKTVP